MTRLHNDNRALAEYACDARDAAWVGGNEQMRFMPAFQHAIGGANSKAA